MHTETIHPELLTITEAAHRCPRRISNNAIWRWCRKGIKAKNGERIHLAHSRMGGQLLIPANALEEFFQQVADSDLEHFDRPAPAPSPAKPKRGRRSAHDQAVALLAKRGL